MFNPHEPLSSRTKRGLGVASVLAVLLVWSLLAGLDLVSQAKLPAPWEVATAMGRLASFNDAGESALLIATLAPLCSPGCRWA